MIALKRNLPNNGNIVDNTDLAMMEQVEVEQEDFDMALKEFIPFSKKIEREPTDNK